MGPETWTQKRPNFWGRNLARQYKSHTTAFASGPNPVSFSGPILGPISKQFRGPVFAQSLYGQGLLISSVCSLPAGPRLLFGQGKAPTESSDQDVRTVSVHPRLCSFRTKIGPKMWASNMASFLPRFRHRCLTAHRRGDAAAFAVVLVGQTPSACRVASFCRENAEHAFLNSGAELGHSEHSFGLRLIAVSTLISCVAADGPKISFIRRTAAQNRGDVWESGSLRSPLPSFLSPLIISVAFFFGFSACSTLLL